MELAHREHTEFLPFRSAITSTASAHGRWAAVTIWFIGLWSSTRMAWALAQSVHSCRCLKLLPDMLWQPSNKRAGYLFFRWSFSNLASQSFGCCQEFINCLSIVKSQRRKHFKCHECIYSECSGEGTLDFLNISSLLSCQYTVRAPPVNLKGRMHSTLSSSASSQIISTRSSHSIIGSFDATPLNTGINCRLKGLLAIAAGFRKSISQHSSAQSTALEMCPSLIPTLYIELSNSPMQNTMHLHRLASYQSQFPCLPTFTHFEGVKSTNQLITSPYALPQGVD